MSTLALSTISPAQIVLINRDQKFIQLRQIRQTAMALFVELPFIGNLLNRDGLTPTAAATTSID